MPAENAISDVFYGHAESIYPTRQGIGPTPLSPLDNESLQRSMATCKAGLEKRGESLHDGEEASGEPIIIPLFSLSLSV